MGGVLAPRVDVAEDDKAVTITAELPGVKESEIEVCLVGDQLTIKGEKRSEHEEQKRSAGTCDTPHGTLLRRLPADANRALPGGARSSLGSSSRTGFSR